MYVLKRKRGVGGCEGSLDKFGAEHALGTVVQADNHMLPESRHEVEDEIQLWLHFVIPCLHQKEANKSQQAPHLCHVRGEGDEHLKPSHEERKLARGCICWVRFMQHAVH